MTRRMSLPVAAVAFCVGLLFSPSLSGPTAARASSTPPTVVDVIAGDLSSSAPPEWMIWSDGTVTPVDAVSYGDLPSLGVHVDDIVGGFATLDGRGYYLVGADGGVFAFGDAHFRGSLPSYHIVPDPPSRAVGGALCNYGQGYLVQMASEEFFPFNCGGFST